MGACGSTNATAADKEPLATANSKSDDVEVAKPGEGMKSSELSHDSDELFAHVVSRLLFLLIGVGYIIVAGLAAFVPPFLSTGFPMYLPQDLVDDAIAMDYLRIALTAVFLIGIGYVPMALNNKEELMFASLFNKPFLLLQAMLAWGLGVMSFSVFLLVLLGDIGSMIVTLIMWAFYPSMIRKEHRRLLGFIPSAPTRNIRSYLLEFEGYFMLISFLLLTIPPIAQAFGSAEVERLHFTYSGVELSGHRLGMFVTATFWFANMYWFYIPAARVNSSGFMAAARQQRLVMVLGWMFLRIFKDDLEHNLVNSLAVFGGLFLGLDLYATTFEDYFRRNPMDDDIERLAAADDSYALFHQAELPNSSRWVVWHSGWVFMTSNIWMFFTSTGFPYLFGKVFPGKVELSYKVHLQDLLLSTLMGLIAAFLLPLVPRDKTSQLVLKTFTFVLPWSTWWFTVETKLLMHLRGGTPFHMSWVDMDLGTKFTELPVDITFFFATFFMTVITPALLVVLGIYLIGSPWSAFKGMNEAATIREALIPARKVALQHMTLLVAFTGGWMILVSSGLPMPTKFLTNLLGMPPLLPVDTRLAVQVHRYDLLLAFTVPNAIWMLSDLPNERVATFRRVSKLCIFASWGYAFFIKLATHFDQAPAFHQAWTDMYGYEQYKEGVTYFFSWLAFVALNFVAFPALLLSAARTWDGSKLLAYNKRYAAMTTPEVLLWTRSMLQMHALLIWLTSGLWLMMTSSGFVWPLKAMSGGNIPPILPSFGADGANPAALRVHFQDAILGTILANLGVFLQYVPQRLTGQRKEMNFLGNQCVLWIWVLSIWAKVMVNAGEDDMQTWVGIGAFGAWRDVRTLTPAHNVLDFIWYLATLIGIFIGPFVMFYMMRNALGDFAKSLRAARLLVGDEDKAGAGEVYLGSALFLLVGRQIEGSYFYRTLTWISHIVSPPEQQYLTVDRIAYSMQAPSKKLRREYFHQVGVGKDEYGWWRCTKVPTEIELFQRNEILPAMSAHTIEKAPGTFLEIMRARAFNASPSWMVWQPLTDEIFDDIFHSRFGAEILRAPTKDELKTYNSMLKKGSASTTSATNRMQGATKRAVAQSRNDSVIVCDLTVLTKGAERKPASAHFPTPDVKIFFTATKYGIRAMGFEFQHLDGAGVELVSNDGSNEWHYAKRLCSTALITAHQIGTHLTHGHLLVESQMVLCYKYLHPEHWVFNFVEPLAGDVQFINETWGLEAILYGTIMDMGPCTSDGLYTIIKNAKQRPAFEGDTTWNLMERLKPEHSGVPEECPFPYRFTARVLEGYVRELVTAVANKYYKPDDEALKRFMKEVYWWRPITAARPTTKEAVIDYLVEFFMNASYRHDYSHDDYLWHAAHALPPQLNPKPVFKDKPSSYLPDKQTFAMTLQIAHALQAGVIETPLEAYYGVYTDNEMRPVVDKFVQQVQGLLVLGGVHEHMNQCGSMTH